jgi:hypothetical protein
MDRGARAAKVRTAPALRSSTDSDQFFDGQSGVRLTDYGRVAAIRFPDQKENIGPLHRRLFANEQFTYPT